MNTVGLKEKVVSFVKTHGIVRPKDLKQLGAPSYYLSLLEKEGRLKKLGRGIYSHIDYEFDEKQTILEVCKLSPKATICLLSAMRFYEFTTQNPFQVWIAIGEKDKISPIGYPPIRVMYFSGKALTEGVDILNYQGVDIRVYNPAKTVADCFKYRNKIGLDVAMEALRDGWRKKLFTIKDLNYYASICRVKSIMRPYIESIL